MPSRAVRPRALPPRGNARDGAIRRAQRWVAVLMLAAGCGTAPTAPDPWQFVRQSEDPAELEAFLRERPDSPHVGDARARLDELLEARDREEAERSGTRAEYVDYLARHPDGPYAETARAAIAHIDEARAWDAAQAAGTRVDYVAFLSAYPRSEKAAEGREAIERLDHDAELALARELDTLAGWEAFVRARPDSPQRAEAGARIEALVEGASPAERTELERVQARIRESRERDADPDLRRFYIVEQRLAAPGEPHRFLVKTENYDYIAIDEFGPEPAPEAFEESVLRFLPPRLVVVERVSQETLFSDEEQVRKQRLQVYYSMTRQAGIDFYTTQLVTCWPRDVQAFRLDEESISTQRGLLGNVLSPQQLLAALLRLPDEHVSWAASRIVAGAVEPPDLESRVLLAVAAGDDERVRALGPAARPTLLRILVEAPRGFATRGARALACNDPGGQTLDELTGAQAAIAVELLADAVHADPTLAAGFVTDGLAWQARQRARERLLAELHGRDDDALAATRKLPLLGWDPAQPSNAVRILALRGAWDEIEAAGAASVVPLLELLSEGEDFRGTALSSVLGRLARDAAPLPDAGALLLRDGRLRARIVLAPWGGRLHGFFAGAALDYLKAAGSPEAMRAFAQTSPDAPWAALAQAWTRDAGGRELDELLAEGKVALTARGKSISSVDLTLDNLCDHDVLTLLVPGLRFEPANARYQNMVTTRAREVLVARGTSESLAIAAACADQGRWIPREEVSFELKRVDPDSDLGRLLPALAARQAPFAVAQASVWVLTDDAGWEQLAALQSVRASSLLGTRLISTADALAALEILDELGVDFRATRLWRDRGRLRSYDAGWSHPWLDRVDPPVRR